MPHQSSCRLSTSIQAAYGAFVSKVARTPAALIDEPIMQGTGGMVCVRDIVAYQIGWGTELIRWYQAGLEGKDPHMPVEGFDTWDYTAIAQQFYRQYHYESLKEQLTHFQRMVEDIITLADKEELAGSLDKLGMWNWCTLRSGKKWPLRKWIQVNTVAPYKRATLSLRQMTRATKQ